MCQIYLDKSVLKSEHSLFFQHLNGASFDFLFQEDVALLKLQSKASIERAFDYLKKEKIKFDAILYNKKIYEKEARYYRPDLNMDKSYTVKEYGEHLIPTSLIEKVLHKYADGLNAESAIVEIANMIDQHDPTLNRVELILDTNNERKETDYV